MTDKELRSKQLMNGFRWRTLHAEKLYNNVFVPLRFCGAGDFANRYVWAKNEIENTQNAFIRSEKELTESDKFEIYDLNYRLCLCRKNLECLLSFAERLFGNKVRKYVKEREELEAQNG